MASAIVIVTIALFLSGAFLGVIAVLALAIRREERCYSLPGHAPDRLSRNARRLTGVGCKGVDAEFFAVARELVH